VSRIFGVVPLKYHSRRLPRKNLLEIDNIPLYERACNVMSKSNVTKTYLLTDFKNEYSKDGYIVMHRPKKLSHYLTPLQEVLKWFLYDKKMHKKCDKIVMAIPPNPYITVDDINKCIDMIDSDIYKIVRSYDNLGRENGIYGFDVDYLSGAYWWYDVYTGAYTVDGIEIHSESEFNIAKKIIEGREK
jgi:CMP-N-acetylneuraminic acid synthetase